LRNFPIPGGGGAHPHELKVANIGIIAGLSADQIFQDLRRSIPQGKRRISDGEITDAINKVLSDHNGSTYTPRPRPTPVVQNGKAALQKIIAQRKISDEVDLWELSLIRLMDEPQHDATLALSILYKPTDRLFIGDRAQPGIIGETIRTAAEWIIHFKNGGKTGPHLLINPLTGTPAPTKTGDKATLRGNGNVAAYRYAVAEFDILSREDQISFWSAIKLPLVALIDSGGKSVHALIDVQQWAKVETPEQWQSEIKVKLYDQLLTPYGVDSACSNTARLSRLPGHFREEKQAYQRLIWLSPEGRPICQ
ncbi:MAG: hypothetical protein AAB425_03065, partial [Bdellovibrionota bacterium]